MPEHEIPLALAAIVEPTASPMGQRRIGGDRGE